MATSATTRVGVRFASIAARAMRYHKHGHPSAVLQVESVTLDTASVGARDVLVRMVCAPLTALDVAAVTGFGGRAPAFPRVGGNEGLGIVEQAGASSGLAKGDVVVASSPGIGTWSTHVIERGESFTKVEGVEAKAGADASALVAAAVGPLVAAKRMLEDFVSLKAGDAVAQSGADSLTGQAVVQLAAARGLRSVSVARGNPAGGWAKFAQHMAGVGATLCVSEEAAARHDFARLLADVPAPRLGLNGSGGAAAGAVARALGQGATLVSYGGAAPSGGRASALQAPLALFTQRDLTLRGFSLARSAGAMAKPSRDAEVREAVAAAASGAVKLLVAREPMADFKAALPRALAAVSAPRGTVAERTVVFTF